MKRKGALVSWVARIPWGCLLLAPTYVVQMLYPLIPLVVRRDLCDGGARTLMCLTPPPRIDRITARVSSCMSLTTHICDGEARTFMCPSPPPPRQAILARDTQCDVLGATGAVVMRTV